MDKQYMDMVSLPHPISRTHTPMPRQDRAAQFAPFAALVGHDAAVEEAARLTARRVELDEGELAVLDRRFAWIAAHQRERPTVTVTYFEPDIAKDGGAYRTVSGTVDKIEEAHGILCLCGCRIPTTDICNITWNGMDETDGI